MDALSFFLGRMRLTVGGGAGLCALKNKLFAFMARNAAEAAAYYGIPTEQVVEVGGQFQL
jgi:KUP system potassium uptake protein